MTLSRHPDLAGLVDADRPAFLFDGTGALVWCNAAAAVFWGAPHPAGLLANTERFSGAASQARDLVRTMPIGSARLERLRLVPFGRTVPLTSQVKRITVEGLDRALLVVGLEGVARARVQAILAKDGRMPEPEPAVAQVPAEASPEPPPSERLAEIAEAAAAPDEPAEMPDEAPASASDEPASTPDLVGSDPAPGESEADVPTAPPPSELVADVAEAADIADEIPDAPEEAVAIDARDGPSETAAAPEASPEFPIGDDERVDAASASDLAAAIAGSLHGGDGDGLDAGLQAALTPLGPAERVDADLDEPQADEAPPVSVTPEPVSAAHEQHAVTTAPETAAWPPRFTWITSPGGRVIQVTSAFRDAVGPGGLPRDGEPMVDFARRHDGLEPLVAALEAATPWTDTTVAWPITDSAARAAVTLSGTVMPGGGVRVLGVFRGIEAPAVTDAAREPEPVQPEMAPAAEEPPVPVLDAEVETAETPAPDAVAETEAATEPAPQPTDTSGSGDEGRDIDNVVAFPAAPRPAAERRLDASDQAALRTIARVLGGPIAVPQSTPAPLPARGETEPAPAPVAAVPVDLPVPSALYVPAPDAAPVAGPDPDPRLGALETALAEAERQVGELTSIIDTATDGVVVLDAAGRILSLNRSGQALFARSPEETVGAAFTDLLAPESHRIALDYLDGLSRNGVASVLNDGREVVGVERNGGRIPLFMTVGRLGTEAAARYCAVLRDVTQWKRAEQDLVEARRQAENASTHKSEFLAKISHEIRTPLNAIIGFSEVMLEERFGRVENERYRGYLADIRTSGEHLLSLVNDLLDLSKIEAGKLDLSFTAVRLGDLVQQAVATMQPQANRDGVILRTSLPRTPPVVADPRSLRQILFNLLSNAIKFTRSGGQVIVSTGLTDDGQVVLRVRDTGTGMTDTEIATALEPFRQVATRGRAQADGTGLGLPLTKALAEANRATFGIESQPGEGTLVQIAFPSTRVLAE